MRTLQMSNHIITKNKDKQNYYQSIGALRLIIASLEHYDSFEQCVPLIVKSVATELLSKTRAKSKLVQDEVKIEMNTHIGMLI